MMQRWTRGLASGQWMPALFPPAMPPVTVKPRRTDPGPSPFSNATTGLNACASIVVVEAPASLSTVIALPR